MSLDSLLGGDTITVSAPTTAKDSSGGLSRTPANPIYTNVPARVEDASATQQLAWNRLEMIVTHTVYTRQTGILNGYMIATSDGRTLQVQGVKKNRGIGSLTDYYELACKETRSQ